MKEFNSEKLVKNLPDVYAKASNSNNYKLLETEHHILSKLRKDLSDIDNILALDNATGKTLDRYGERVGQVRGRLPDEKYLVLIKARIARNVTNCSFNSFIDCICKTFSCDVKDVAIVEGNTPCHVQSVTIPIPVIIKSGFSSKETWEIIKSLLPVGVTLDKYDLEGTFCFGNSENEQDNEKGFATAENATDNIGGYFGVVGNNFEDIELPI